MVDKVPASGMRRMAKDTQGLARRTREVERPSGSQYARLVEQVEQKLGQIDQQVADAINAQSYTKDNIDSKFSDVNNALGGKANSSHTHTQDQVSGTWTKDVSNSGSVATNLLYATGAPGYNITSTRVAAWWQSSDGRAGTASSSERFKSNITDWDGDPAAVLEMVPVMYQYTEQVDLAEKFHAGTVPYRYDPAFKAHHELGFIAERLAELGFWEVVVWERDAADQLVFGDDGKPIPFGIHYHLIAVLQQVALQWLNRRLERIEEQLGLGPIK